MTADDVIELYSLFKDHGITIWIDGGWSVDALLGKQTRPHADLDIAIDEKDVAHLREILEARGFRDVPRDDTTRWNFVLGDDRGRLVDVHSFIRDANGNVTDGIAYPLESLTGTGNIAGHAVACISPEHLVKFHTGYAIRETDRMDVAALCERFEIELPEEYRR